jgi:FkbM family methyltransferase
MLAAAVARTVVSPFVPSRKMLPFMCWLSIASGDFDAERLHLDKLCTSAKAAIDVGANSGWYTYPLSKIFRRVYAFEINEDLTGWIKQYNPGNIELIHCGLSSTAGTARFYVPVTHGQAMTGWGSLHRDNLPGADAYLEKEIRIAPLDDFGIADVGFIKIDVEGHEVEVLMGAAKTIAQSRPVVLVEVRPAHERTIDAWFRALDYRNCTLEELVRVHRSTEGNRIYVPLEQLAHFGIIS